MPTIEREELERKLEEGEVGALVEVLDPSMYRKFHLPGAINVPLNGAFEDNIQRAVPDKTEPVVVYCQDIDCEASPQAASTMERLGYRQVFDYVAGKDDWRRAGLPIES